jgi:hypothetical protein
LITRKEPEQQFVISAPAPGGYLIGSLAHGYGSGSPKLGERIERKERGGREINRGNGFNRNTRQRTGKDENKSVGQLEN